MFEWLEQELVAIRTPKFHLVDGPATDQLAQAIMSANLGLPKSYKEFVIRYGNAKLYRIARNNSYKIGIFAGPRQTVLSNSLHAYEVGFHDGTKVYIQPISEFSGVAKIWESDGGSIEPVGDDFEQWLASCCTHARKQYGPAKWAEIVRGPKSFTPEEREIVKARRLITWRLSEIDEKGNHVFEICNNSNRKLAALTVGIRSHDRRLNGAVILEIGHIGPGQTENVTAACYKDIMSPMEIEAFELPDPNPEDRDFYGEFRSETMRKLMGS